MLNEKEEKIKDLLKEIIIKEFCWKLRNLKIAELKKNEGYIRIKDGVSEEYQIPEYNFLRSRYAALNELIDEGLISRKHRGTYITYYTKGDTKIPSERETHINKRTILLFESGIINQFPNGSMKSFTSSKELSREIEKILFDMIKDMKPLYMDEVVSKKWVIRITFTKFYNPFKSGSLNRSEVLKLLSLENEATSMLVKEINKKEKLETFKNFILLMRKFSTSIMNIDNRKEITYAKHLYDQWNKESIR